MKGVQPADLRTREAKSAQEYMAKKGYEEIRPLGVIQVENDDCWYFYYRLPEGVLELEVVLDRDTQRFSRQVATFVTDPDRVRELLAG
jgi:hypothetical protein